MRDVLRGLHYVLVAWLFVAAVVLLVICFVTWTWQTLVVLITSLAFFAGWKREDV